MSESAETKSPSLPIVGVYSVAPGVIQVFRRKTDGATVSEETAYCPFAWLKQRPDRDLRCEELSGPGEGKFLAFFDEPESALATLKELSPLVAEQIRPLEHAWLLQSGQRFGRDLSFSGWRRLQLDIETASSTAAFSNPGNPGDRVLAIGLRHGGKNELLLLEEETDAAERLLLKRLNERLAAIDPDIIEGHNIFRFDLDFLKRRCARYRVPCAWGRGGEKAVFRPSRLKVAERTVDFPRCDIPGRTVFDTYLMVQLWDIGARELPSYGLKAVASHFGFSSADDRTYLPGDQIQTAFREDRASFSAYLEDDLKETEALASVLLPNYIAQAQIIPMTLQEVCLRGTAQKVESLLLPHYYAKRQSLPSAPGTVSFAGGLTSGEKQGVFHGVLHFDIASLYPSLLLLIDRAPRGDSLGVFLEVLRDLREQRLRYKQEAREASGTPEAVDLQARQNSFKILINSFYGYLGFGNARFGDPELAAEVTSRGRELLQGLMDKFEAAGYPVLEADTDGIYVHARDAFSDPDGLLESISSDLPKGIDLELGGVYDAMFCYKSKNYALREGSKLIVRGSGLRSRGMEPFLRELTQRLLAYKLGLEKENPLVLARDMETAIKGGDYPVKKLAKRESLSMAPAAYQRAVEEKNKPRRASMEVALRLSEVPGSGDQVTYFIRPREKGEPAADWARAVALEEYDAETLPYDPAYYTKKLREWVRRFRAFLETDLFD